jgi:DNA-directed RNA polymerase subunit RPC12/RpoP
MKETTRVPRPAQGLYRPGTYLRCGACGRLLKIEWATRSIVCACGERVTPPPVEKGGK